MDVGCWFTIDNVASYFACATLQSARNEGRYGSIHQLENRRGRGCGESNAPTCYRASLHFWFASITLWNTHSCTCTCFVLHPSAPLAAQLTFFLFFYFFFFPSPPFFSSPGSPCHKQTMPIQRKYSSLAIMQGGNKPKSYAYVFAKLNALFKKADGHNASNRKSKSCVANAVYPVHEGL